MAQATPGSVMAQGYHHAILPLASARDRRTEIRWAIRDVELRTGYRPAGLWLPEAAVDWLSLRIAAEEGIAINTSENAWWKHYSLAGPAGPVP